MATDPVFASTPHVGAILLNAAADTSLTAPTNIATVFTAGASGSKVEQVRLMQVVSTTSAGVINVFLYDGSTYHLIDNYPYGIVTLSTTSEPIPVDWFYNNLVFASGWSIRATNTVTSSGGPTAANFKVIAFGADY